MALFERSSALLMYWLMWKAYEAQMRLDDVQFVFSSAIADVAARVQPAEREEPDEIASRLARGRQTMFQQQTRST